MRAEGLGMIVLSQEEEGPSRDVEIHSKACRLLELVQI